MFGTDNISALNPATAPIERIEKPVPFYLRSIILSKHYANYEKYRCKVDSVSEHEKIAEVDDIE